MTTFPIIDIHAHFTPPEWIDELKRNGVAYGCTIQQDGSGRLWLRLAEGRPKELTPPLADLAARVRVMAEMGVDRQVLSPVMTTIGYELEERYGQALSRLFNETNAETVKRHNGLFIPVANVPMQSSRAAVEELDHAVKKLGIRMVEIGTHVNGLNLDEEAFRPFFERAANLGVLVQVHPHRVAAADRLRRYNLGNLIGNPMDTAIAAASLIFGGVLDRYPSLNVCLVHGGGALPYLMGRMSHGYSAFDESHAVPSPPQEYFGRFYFDTLTHDSRMLSFLHSLTGDERLMLGTDCPYDSGDKEPLAKLRKARLENRQSILGGNAARLLGLS
jgi:aminocarboxymuconate-semialdehyde decarboxylase